MLEFCGFALLVVGFSLALWYGAWRVLLGKAKDTERLGGIEIGQCAACGSSLDSQSSPNCSTCGAATDACIAQGSVVTRRDTAGLVLTLVLGGLVYLGVYARFGSKDQLLVTLVFGAPVLALVPWAFLRWLASARPSVPRRAVLFTGCCAIVSQVVTFVAIYVTRPLSGAGMEALGLVLLMPIPLCAVSAGVGAFAGSLLIATGRLDRWCGY